MGVVCDMQESFKLEQNIVKHQDDVIIEKARQLKEIHGKFK